MGLCESPVFDDRLQSTLAFSCLGKCFIIRMADGFRRMKGNQLLNSLAERRLIHIDPFLRSPGIIPGKMFFFFSFCLSNFVHMFVRVCVC